MKIVENGKRIIVGLAVAATLCMFLFAVLAMPKGATSIDLRFSCVEIDEDGAPVRQPDRCGEIRSDLNGIGTIWLNASLKFVRGAKIDEQPTDVQLAEIRFVKENRQVGDRILIARDFYSGKTFVSRKEGEWRLVKFPKRLDGAMTVAMESAIYIIDDIPRNWRGKAIYCYEEFQDFNKDAMTFRYNLSWLPEAVHENFDGFKNSGFKNTEPTEINSTSDAIARAAEELSIEAPVAVTFYDETCGYWLVEIYENTTYTPVDKSDYADYLFDLSVRGLIWTVIMDGNGITLETYNDFTRFAPFWELAGL